MSITQLLCLTGNGLRHLDAIAMEQEHFCCHRRNLLLSKNLVFTDMLVDISNQTLRKEKGVRIPPAPDYEKYFFVGWGFLRRIQMNEKEIIRECLRLSKISQEELKNRLGYATQSGVSNKLNSGKSMNVSTFVKMLDAMGYRLVVESKSPRLNNQSWVVGIEGGEK